MTTPRSQELSRDARSVLGLACRRYRRAGAAAQTGQSGGVTAQAGFDQELGAKLPLAAHFRDESGRELPLGDYFGRRPVILAPVYYGCPLLCGQVLAGLTRGLKPLSLEAGKDFDVIAFSIDPDEGPALALSKKTAYLERYDRPGTESGWHFLTGEQASITALAETIGFRYTYNPANQAFYPCRRGGRRDTGRRRVALLLRHRLSAQGASARARAGPRRPGGLADRQAAACSVMTTTRRPASTRCRSCGSCACWGRRRPCRWRASCS